MIRITVLTILTALSYHPITPKLISGRFVASDKFQGLTNPREPVQRLFVEAQDNDAANSLRLLKVIYYPETNGRRGGAKFLSDATLNYKNVWKLNLHRPQADREKDACRQFDNYFRASDGSIDTDGKEPLLRYRSTQFNADVRFENLSEMPCMILDSIEQ